MIERTDAFDRTNDTNRMAIAPFIAIVTEVSESTLDIGTTLIAIHANDISSLFDLLATLDTSRIIAAAFTLIAMTSLRARTLTTTS